MRHWDPEGWMYQETHQGPRYLYDTQWSLLGPGFVDYTTGYVWAGEPIDLHCSKADVYRWCQAHRYTLDRRE